MGEMLEVWGVDSLQEMLDTSPLQYTSQVEDVFASFDSLSGGCMRSFPGLVFCHSLASFRLLVMRILRIGDSSLGLAPMPLLEPVAREGERTSQSLRACAFLEFVKTRREVRRD